MHSKHFDPRPHKPIQADARYREMCDEQDRYGEPDDATDRKDCPSCGKSLKIRHGKYPYHGGHGQGDMRCSMSNRPVQEVSA